MIAWVLNTYRRYLQPWYEEEATAAARWYRRFGATLRERDDALAQVETLQKALRRIELWPFDVMREAHEDLAAIKEFAALAASPVRATPEAECDACGRSATCYDMDGQWCDDHGRATAGEGGEG